MNHVKQTLQILLLLILIGSYTFLVLSGSISFTPWGQVSYVHEHGGLSLSDVYSHPHAIRYLLVYPVYMLQAEFEGASLSITFSIYLELTLIMAALLIARAVILSMKTVVFPFFWLFLVVLLALFLMSYFMNGRLLIAFLAVACLVVFCVAIMQPIKSKLSYFALLGALLFGNVTSGVFLAICSALFLVFVCRVVNCSLFKGVWAVRELLFVLTGLLFVPVAYLLFFKNVDYFVAQEIDMLSHGLDLFNRNYWQLNLIWIVGVLLIVSYVFTQGFKRVFKSEKIYLVLAYTAFLVLSIYAYSIVAVSVIFAITLSCILVLSAQSRWPHG